METLNKIDKLIAKRNNPSNHLKVQLSRQKRLQNLVDVWGMEVVARASGLAVSSLNQYLRNKRPSTIGEQSVLDAEEIIAQL